MRNLEGLTIVMMGATGGMGTATALRIAKPGVNLAFSSSRGERVRELEEKLSLTGAGVFGAVVDVTDDAQVRDYMQAVYDRFGRVDILINFAGLSITRKLEDFKANPTKEGVLLKGKKRTTVKLFIPDLTFAEKKTRLEMGDTVWVYMGEYYPCYCVYWPQA